MDRFVIGLNNCVGALNGILGQFSSQPEQTTDKMADDMEYQMSSPPQQQIRSGPGRPGNWTAPMFRILLDYIEEEKGPDSIFLTDRVAASDEAVRRMEELCPPHQYVKRDKKQIDNKLSSLCEHGTEHGTSIKKLLTNGLSVVIFSKVLKGVFSEEEIQTDTDKRKKRKRAQYAKIEERRNQRVVEPVDVQPLKTETESRDPSMASDFSQVTALEDVVVCAGSPDKAAISEAMTDIANKIESCVSARLAGAGISAHNPTVFNFEAFGDWLCELLMSVGGCDRTRLQERYMQIMNMQSQQRLDLATFLRSVVGAAVTLWAMQPSPLKTSGAMYEDLISEWQLGKCS